ncbi:MAG: hypothetical protein FWG55_04000 [Candidatus Bathyarchaeota archaeon]|nr:hypothetical protein [Candidatus Termiticorpusculum sp.]
MILIVDMNWKKDSLAFNEFVQSIVNIVKPLEDCTVKHYMELRISELEMFSKIILSGNALKDSQVFEHIDKFSWIKTLNCPILGVDTGMQIISLVFGIPLMSCRQIGITEVQTVKDNPLFEGTFNVYTLHNYSVSPSETFDVMAQTGKCIQAIKHKQKNIYGVLFHPEVRNSHVLEQFVVFKKM